MSMAMSKDTQSPALHAADSHEIAVQVLIIPLSILQPAIFVPGLAQGFVALFWLRRLGHLRFEDRAGSPN